MLRSTELGSVIPRHGRSPSHHSISFMLVRYLWETSDDNHMKLVLHVTKSQLYVLVMVSIVISSALLALATGFTSGQPSHATLFTDILRGKSGSSILVSDKLGIGVSPAAPLSIRQVTDSQSGGTAGFRLENTAGSAISQLLTGADNNAYWFAGSGNSYVMIQQSSGNVGVQTTGPQKRLHVLTSGNIGDGMFLQSPADQGARYYVQKNACGAFPTYSVGLFDTSCSQSFTIRDEVAGAQRLTITNAGAVQVNALAGGGTTQVCADNAGTLFRC